MTKAIHTYLQPKVIIQKHNGTDLTEIRILIFVRFSSLTATQKGLVAKDKETPSPVFRRSSAPDMRKNRLSVASYSAYPTNTKEEEDDEEEEKPVENVRALRGKSMVRIY